MWQSIKKLFKSNYLFTFGVIICLFWILMAILAPVLAPYDPVAQDLTIRLSAAQCGTLVWYGQFRAGYFQPCALRRKIFSSGRLPDRRYRRNYRNFLRSYCRLCGRGRRQCDDAFFGDDFIISFSDSGYDHQCGDGIESV